MENFKVFVDAQKLAEHYPKVFICMVPTISSRWRLVDGRGADSESHKCPAKVQIVTTRSIGMWASWNMYMAKKVYPALGVSIAGHYDHGISWDLTG